MIIDRETFTELAVQLKLASDSVLDTARCLAQLDAHGAEIAGMLDAVTATHERISSMEQLLRAVFEANKEEKQSPPTQ